ncbi:hypothetical protein FLAV_01628 [Flavobacteriales bacterium]|nr:hypothetical protein [Flavobacteriales bacterium]MCL4815951.1 PorP/SprF family type IX secretion system membrane protein [Flavobacteriales bacterium]WKZ74283.1 MAG: PorP/SprF family type IX secretion system membrane protein [Vicingaceae bacterium]GIK70656.1 MAG: hypothetical protein BroJett020_19510 [Bacteroidota bacterium]CAG0978342.1 hypothetical protein FLAV_01628 [Flavobacteriales bacterium]
MKRSIIIILLTTCISIVQAQDFHLSQYEASAVFLNAANTGIMEGSYRASIQGRNQWRAFTTRPYVSMVANFDMPLNERWGLGGYLIANEAAVGYNDQHLVLSGAYRITTPGQDKHVLSAGLQLGVIQKDMRDNLIFDSQYSEGTFDKNISSGETELAQSKFLPEINMGMAYKMKDENASVNPYAGLSVFHISSPNESFVSLKTPLPRRFMFYSGFEIKTNDKVLITPRVLAMTQGKNKEINAGIKGEYKWPEEKVSLLADVGYRFNDAVIAGLGLRYNEFIYRISYDITTSGLKKHSGGKGALEFSVVFMRAKK